MPNTPFKWTNGGNTFNWTNTGQAFVWTSLAIFGQSTITAVMQAKRAIRPFITRF